MLDRLLDGLDVADRDLAGAAILLRVKGDLLAFRQPTHARAFERGRMDEHVLAAVVRLDEAEAFLTIVELHGTGIHGDSLRLTLSAREPTRRASAASGSVRSMFGESQNVRPA